MNSKDKVIIDYNKQKRVYAYKLFVKFLKNEGILNNYIEELTKLESQHFRRDITNQLMNPMQFIANDLFCCLGENLISQAFAWSCTKEGRHFWTDKDKKWCDIQQKLKNELKTYETKLIDKYETCYNGGF